MEKGFVVLTEQELERELRESYMQGQNHPEDEGYEQGNYIRYRLQLITKAKNN